MARTLTAATTSGGVHAAASAIASLDQPDVSLRKKHQETPGNTRKHQETSKKNSWICWGSSLKCQLLNTFDGGLNDDLKRPMRPPISGAAYEMMAEAVRTGAGLVFC